ncbi:neurocalcin-delta-like isoform X2 [Mercenaria mercenaria]|uniref:neurocalcin-delta-like isoform X2 n=1 Tax=Mercenaria mercenaria TaxID=6596 RepID=UPI00234EECD1|nr:neurocalcin-delta-like isoform X2 [Mercenaria mercenaria]
MEATRSEQMGSKSSKRSLNPESLQQLRNEVNLSPEEIQAWYKEYLTSLRGGQQELTRDEFKKVYNSLFIGDASKFAEHVFRTFDKDGSGTVNFKEFLIGLCVSGSDTNNEVKLKWAFNMYDINGDGFINKSEMKEIVEAIYKMTNAMAPKELDTPEKMTEKLFEEFDLNKDGHITFEEFKEGASKDPVIINLLECDPDPDS